MNKKQSRRRRDIKSKLMAAICMLLVSSIMMVSTTYAWFTLSTAPEVTGITTAVGANGNLEMALQPYDGNSEAIVSSTSDSMATQDVEKANITWGNLVSLKGKDGSDIYGMDRITLYPAALNKATDTTIGENPLSTPEYGADGRVSALVTKTITGVWNGEGFTEDIDGESAPIENAKGVRAIGVSSGMSDRQLAYRAAMASASTADSQARSMASSSLSRNGASLADVAITHALNEDGSALYTEAQVASMRATLNDLIGYDNGGEHVTGSLEYIKNALLNYILADTLAGASDEGYGDIVTAFSSVTLDTVAANATFQTSAAKFATYIGQLNDAIDAATDARDGLPSGKTAYTWAEISGALGGLVDTDYLEINGKLVSEVMADPGAMASSIMKNGLNLTMKSGAGVYADIADFSGNYSASIIIPELSYGTGPDAITVPDVEATMATSTSVNPVHLKAAQAAVTQFTASTGGSSSASISDFYGYIIDLAFRTNAADSYLQLQSTAVDRVYAGNEQNEATMGGGAYMKFTSASDNFTQEAMKRLMGAIRIVFFETDTKDVIGYARLNANAVDPDTSTGVKMPLMMTDAGGNALVDDTGTAWNETVAIMALDQNVVHELSVMVYLDGENVGNDDVAFDTAKSMTGSMNLQFSSSATLVPMEYTDLRTGTGETTPATTLPEITGTITPTVTIDTAVTDLTNDSVSAVAKSDAGYGFSVTGYDSAKHVVTAQITTASGTTAATLIPSGTSFAFTSAEEVTAVAINIAANTQNP